MKNFYIVLLAVLLIFSFAACTAAPAEKTIVPTPEATPQLTPSPTPEPTSTPELFTEEEKVYLEYIELLGFYDDEDVGMYDLIGNRDLYAILLLGDAYNKGNLGNIINENKLTSGQLNTLIEATVHLKSHYFIEHDLFSGNEQERINYYSPLEGLIKILRGDTEKLSYNTLGNIQINFQQSILGDTQPFSANPKESRENIKELIALFDEAVETKNVDKFDERMNSDNYNILEKWQVIEYCLLHGTNDIEWQSPTIRYKGEQMTFVSYAIDSGLVEKIHNELEDYLITNYLREEDRDYILEIR